MRTVLACLAVSIAATACTAGKPGAAGAGAVGADPQQKGAFAGASSDLDRFAQTIASLMLPAGPERGPGDWRDLETARWISWQTPTPRSSNVAAPYASEYTRRGTASFDGRRFAVQARGSRDALYEISFRNEGAAIGEGAAVAALQGADFIVALARCPLPASAMASDNWWQIVGPGKRPAFFHSEKVCEDADCERFALLLADALPPLSTSERIRYTDHCTDDASAGPIAARDRDAPSGGGGSNPSVPVAH